MFVPFALALLAGATVAPTLTVHADQPVCKVSPTLYGIFFEEINNAGDGGLYAEMVRNGRFEDSDKPEHWSPVGGASLSLDQHRVLEVSGPKGAGAANKGYWGMGVKRGERYRVTLRAAIDPKSSIVIMLETPEGKELCRQTVGSRDGVQFEAELAPSASSPNAQLVVRNPSDQPWGIISASLFPVDTWKDRPNGLRSDLAKALDALGPAFVRFPGGCWVEGDVCATAYRWKNTIGPLYTRATVPNLWGYRSGNGLGFHEYLQLCEDLRAEPLFVINCGMSHKEVVPMDKMDEYVQDALDAVEYANGPVTSKWGAVRAENGHPKPFGLKYMEIGNENGGPAYAERYPLFVKAIKEKYPDMHLVCNVWGGIPSTAPVEMVDEHYYSSPDFFIQNADRYDTYDRKGPKVYVGEYAVTQGCGNGNLAAALGEAAFMTGLERNSDIVVMASYAPLLANVNAKGWNPDLVYFDSSRVCGTPSYYVQRLFSLNRSNEVVRSELTGVETKRGSFPDGGVGVGTWRTQAEFKDIQLIEGGQTVYASADGSGLRIEGGTWTTLDGATRQTSGAEGARAWIGSPTLHDYTLRLKARKVSGDEGFLVTFGRKDERNYLWWNIGGWGNTQDAIERAVDGTKSLVGRAVRSKVETGRWYDVQVDYSPSHVTCTLDGKVVFSEDFPAVKPLHYVVGRTLSGDLVLKAVNVTSEAIKLDTVVQGMGAVRSARVETLTSPSLQDENTLDQPEKVRPVSERAALSSNVLHHTLPAHSVTVVRFFATE